MKQLKISGEVILCGITNTIHTAYRKPILNILCTISEKRHCLHLMLIFLKAASPFIFAFFVFLPVFVPVSEGGVLFHKPTLSRQVSPPPKSAQWV